MYNLQQPRSKHEEAYLSQNHYYTSFKIHNTLSVLNTPSQTNQTYCFKKHEIISRRNVKFNRHVMEGVLISHYC